MMHADLSGFSVNSGLVILTCVAEHADYSESTAKHSLVQIFMSL